MKKKGIVLFNAVGAVSIWFMFSACLFGYPFPERVLKSLMKISVLFFLAETPVYTL